MNKKEKEKWLKNNINNRALNEFIEKQIHYKISRKYKEQIEIDNLDKIVILNQKFKVDVKAKSISGIIFSKNKFAMALERVVILAEIVNKIFKDTKYKIIDFNFEVNEPFCNLENDQKNYCTISIDNNLNITLERDIDCKIQKHNSEKFFEFFSYIHKYLDDESEYINIALDAKSNSIVIDDFITLNNQFSLSDPNVCDNVAKYIEEIDNLINKLEN